MNEAAGTALVPVVLTAPSAFTITVAYATSNGTATVGSDYTSASGTLTFAPSQTSLNVSIPILNDATAEANETVNLTLSSPTNATIGGTNPATLTIVDNDGGASGSDEFYQYDALGDLLQKGASAYTYGATAASCVAGTPTSKPHAAVTAGAASYTYDCDGNMLSGGTRTAIHWDTENRADSITTGGVPETYGYDADGERITRTNSGVTTVYLGGLWEETSSGAVKQYYPFNGTVVAVRDSSAGVSYLHADHLGSVSVTSGAQPGGQTFGPWGNVTSGSSSATSMNYTGQYLDSTSGLLYYHARYYDAILARFISADTQAASLDNPQDLNPYSYVRNNPLTYNDPSGHCIPGIGDCQYTGSLNWSDGAAYATGVAEGAASVIEGIVTAPIAIAQAVSDPAAAVQGVQDQAATVGRGAQFVASDPSGAAAALNADPHGVGRVLGQAAGTAALAVLGGEGGAASEEGEAGVGGACSFSVDTLVATEAGTTPIGDLRVGDHVLAFDQATGSTGSYAVTAVLVHIDPILIHLTIAGERIETTPEHPFYVLLRGWVPAGEVHRDDRVRTVNGNYGAVQRVTVEQRSQAMYNLTIATAHTFFVGRGRWLVHNTCATRFNPDQDAVVQLAKEARQKGGLSIEEGRALRQMAEDTGVPYRPHVSMDSEIHPGRGLGGNQPHIHVGPVNHLPIK